MIGNSGYAHAAALPNPVNDASDMAAVLKGVGMEVILGLDLDKRGFDAKVRELSRALAGADVAILFYAGHGLQVGSRDYLIPIDAELQSERDLEFETVPLDFVCDRWRSGARVRPTSSSSAPAATIPWRAASPARWGRDRSASAAIGSIQRRMAERGQQQRRLRAEIAKLETELGPAGPAQ